MEADELVRDTADHVKELMTGEASGHDWWHVFRVWQLAIHIGSDMDADMTVVQLGALLHDIADWKFHDGDTEIGPRVARQWLESRQAESALVEHVSNIVATVSFEGAGVPDAPATLEAQIVQDADRLDAMGAVGIGRAFAFGGAHGREMYDPATLPQFHASFESYKASGSPTINHFYEKLFLLKDRMNTPCARQIAEERHRYMENFIIQFHHEWDGKL